MQTNILDYMNESLARVPDKVAFVSNEESLTFKEFGDKVKRVGSYLIKKDIYRQPIIVFMEKQPSTIATFFGVIAGGNYYIPIDAEMPAIRIQLIIDNVKPPLIICDDNTLANAKEFNFDGEIVLFKDVVKTDIDEAGLSRVYDDTLDTDPTYIVFTSGSTGIPKGVTACHRAVIDYIEQLTLVIEADENSVFGNQTPLYVDACLKEIISTLKFGGTTYLIPKEYFMFPIKLVEYMNENKINTVCWVVSALTMISAFDTFKTVKPEYLRCIAFASEVFPIKQFKKWKAAVPDAKYINLYGPTEATGVCCYYVVDREFEDDEVIPCGRPFKNRQLLLLDDNGNKVPQGEVGEICIRGTTLALGYYNNPEKTKEAFVQNPLNPFYPERIYKTGDLGRINANGELEFVSRKDYQIKHMGHRIELGEIEINVNSFDGIKMSGCVYDKEKGKIILFYTGDMAEKDLTALLKEKLPRYMIPNRVRKIEAMPFTSNGKLDRNKLLSMK